MSEVSGPRIAPLPPDQWSDEVMQAIALLRPPDAKHQLPRRQGGPKGLNVLGTLANHPALMHAYHAFNGHILSSSTLTPRDRELLILRVAALRDADYEWQQHVVIASGAGVTDEEIERVRAGADAPGWSDHDAAMLRAVDELVVDALVGDVTWGKLAEEFDTQQLMDLVFTVGAYDLLAMAFRSFGIELDADLAPPTS